VISLFSEYLYKLIGISHQIVIIMNDVLFGCFDAEDIESLPAKTEGKCKYHLISIDKCFITDEN
jgi:hypothetical protein